MLSQVDYFKNILELKKKLGTSGAKSLAVASGKGGVGKSNISLNLALSFAEDSQVLLLDGDPGLADLHIMLGDTPEYNWGDFLNNTRSFHEVCSPVRKNLDLIHGFAGLNNMSWIEAEAMQKIIRAMHGISHLYEHLIIDVGAGLSEASLGFCTTVDVVLLVLVPELTSLADAYSTAKTIWKFNPNQKIEVIVNSVADANEGKKTYNNLAQVCRQFLQREPGYVGHLSKDSLLPKSLLMQKPVVEAYPDSLYAQDIKKLLPDVKKLWDPSDIRV